jgi:hypothetical protein
MVANWSDVFQVFLIACVASAVLSTGICWTMPRHKNLGYNSLP